jgi:hypothetical protein
MLDLQVAKRRESCTGHSGLASDIEPPEKRARSSNWALEECAYIYIEMLI